MAINSVSSGNNYVSQVQPQPQTQAERVAEKKQDENRVDKGSKAAVEAAQSAPPQPTVNTSGQTVGAVINVKA